MVYYTTDGDDILIATMAARQGQGRPACGQASICVLDEWPLTYLQLYGPTPRLTSITLISTMARVAEIMSRQPPRRLGGRGNAPREDRVLIRLSPQWWSQSPYVPPATTGASCAWSCAASAVEVTRCAWSTGSTPPLLAPLGRVFGRYERLTTSVMRPEDAGLD
jgi:hypothetical protein